MRPEYQDEISILDRVQLHIQVDTIRVFFLSVVNVKGSDLNYVQKLML